jgi:hypothetical protein
MPGRELEHEAAAEGVADPVGSVDPERVERLDEVGDVGRECPGRLEARAPVSAQIRRDYVEISAPAFRCEAAEPLAMPGDAVDADERRSARVAPLVNVEDQVDSSPFPDGV